MPTVSYDTLSPTGDPVTYDDTLLVYPDPDVISTFGPIFTPRIHSKYMDTLEIASSGKVALTLSDSHALDMQLDAGLDLVELVARGGNSLAVSSERDAALRAGSEVVVSSGGSGASNSLTLGASGVAVLTERDALVSGADAVTLSNAGDGAENRVSLTSEGVTISSALDRQVSINIGGTSVARAFFDPEDGRHKFSIPSVVTDSGLDSDRLTKKVTFHGGAPGALLSDGAANDASGIRVAGAPSVVVDNRSYFDKSFLWRSPDLGQEANSMKSLGTGAGHDKESYWDLRGGAFRMTHVNHSSGDELSYVFRVNDSDELELVKRILDRNSGAETFETVQRFGQSRRDLVDGALVTRNRGGFQFLNIDIPADLSAVSFDARTFNVYRAYDAVFAVTEQLDAVDTAELLALGDAGDPAVVKFSGLAPNAHRTNRVSFPSLLKGGAFQENRVYVIVAAVREEGGGLASVRPVRGSFFMSGTDEQIFAQSAEQDPQTASDQALSVASPVGLVLNLNLDQAKAAILNTTQELLDFYLAEPTVDPELHPDGKTPESVTAWILANYPDFVPFVDAGEFGVYVPEPGVDAQDFRYWQALDAVEKAGVYGYAVPASHTVASKHATGHDGAPDSYGRPTGFVVIEAGAARYVPEETPSVANGWTVVPGGRTPRTVNGTLVDQASTWQLVIDFVDANDVWALPRDWEDDYTA